MEYFNMKGNKNSLCMINISCFAFTNNGQSLYYFRQVGLKWKAHTHTQKKKSTNYTVYA